MIPVFKQHLHQSISERVVRIGKFDGIHPSFVCGTTSGKVLIHSPHQASSKLAEERIQYLNVNRDVTALCVGKFSKDDVCDMLVIGTKQSLLLYNVEKNSDVFYKDLPDGANAIVFAPMSLLGDEMQSSNMILVGGNCSIQGFDCQGNELLWTVTGDNVGTMVLGDVIGHHHPQLLVGTDDFEIQAYLHTQVVYDCVETSAVVALLCIQKETFAYALQNGTAGIYRGKIRAWRVKSSKIPVALETFDINGDGEQELIIGWGNGKVEARKVINGDLLYKFTFSAPIAAILSSDFKMDGTTQLICCAKDGEIRGYSSSTVYANNMRSTELAEQHEKELTRLHKLKAKLQFELRSLEFSKTPASKSNGALLRIPSSIDVKISQSTSSSSSSLELIVSTGNESVIKMVIFYDYDAGVFDGESFIVRPSAPLSTVICRLKLTKNVSVVFDIRILIGSKSNNSFFHVIQRSYQMPKFAMFTQVPEGECANDTDGVRFQSFVRPQQLYLWVKQVFIVSMPWTQDTEHFALSFVSLRDKKLLTIHYNATQTVFSTSDIHLASEMVQDMCSHLKCRELESIACFPKEMQDLRTLFDKTEELNAIRLKLTGEMAEDSLIIKDLVVRAEDARALEDMKRMRQYYSKLFTLNGQLLGEFAKRSNNQQTLLHAVKEMNKTIQSIASLRCGNARANVISACRSAIRSKNIPAVFHILLTGREKY